MTAVLKTVKQSSKGGGSFTTPRESTAQKHSKLGADQPEQFVFVLEHGFTMHAFSSAVEVLRLAQKFGGATAPIYSVASIGNNPVYASNGIAVMTDRCIDDLPRRAILVIVSGAGVRTTANKDLVARMRMWDRQGYGIWAISSGVVRLAQAGLVDGATISAHWEDIPYIKENHHHATVSTSLFISSGKHPTCCGGGAAADLMLDYIRREISDDLVDDIASRLMIDGARDGRLSQSLPVQMRYVTGSKTVFAAIRMMEKNRHTALPILEIARRIGISLRQLERLFTTEFGRTPGGVYKELRLAQARQDVIAGRRPLNEIAWDYGFEPPQFAKAYRQTFGLLPSDDRRRQHPSRAQYGARNDDKSTSRASGEQ